jgi:hypothetical protein
MSKKNLQQDWPNYLSTSALLVTVGLTLSQAPLQALEPVNLASPGTTVRLPNIDSEGFATAMAWVETSLNGKEEIRTLLVKDSLIHPQILRSTIKSVPHTPAGSICDLTITMPSKGSAPSLLWVEDTEEESALYYWDRRDTPLEITRTDRIIEFPVMEIDSTGQVILTWSEVSGGQSRLVAAIRSEKKQWTEVKISRHERPYDVLPQLFPLSKGAELYWFSLEDGFVAAQTGTLSQELDFTASENSLGTLAADRLPMLYHVGQKNQLGAIWLEQNDDSEIYRILDPRAPGEDPINLGDGTAIEAPSVSSDQFAAFVWFENNENGDKELVAIHPRTKARHLVTRSAQEPAISATSNFLHLLWTDESDQGEQTLFYWRIK